jgi:hypothetical protein
MYGISKLFSAAVASILLLGVAVTLPNAARAQDTVALNAAIATDSNAGIAALVVANKDNPAALAAIANALVNSGKASLIAIALNAAAGTDNSSVALAALANAAVAQAIAIGNPGLIGTAMTQATNLPGNAGVGVITALAGAVSANPSVNSNPALVVTILNSASAAAKNVAGPVIAQNTALTTSVQAAQAPTTSPGSTQQGSGSLNPQCNASCST